MDLSFIYAYKLSSTFSITNSSNGKTAELSEVPDCDGSRCGFLNDILEEW